MSAFTREEAVRFVEQMLFDLEHNRHSTETTVVNFLAEGPRDTNVGRAMSDAIADARVRVAAGDSSPELIRRIQLLLVLAGERPLSDLD